MDPVTLALIGGGSSLASMFFNNSANNAVNEARANAINAERARQAQYDAEAKGITDKSLGRYANFDTGMADDAKRLSDYFKTEVTTPNTPYTVAALPPAASDLVANEIAKRSGIANAYVQHQADSLGKLRSFGDYFGGIGRGVVRDTQAVGQIGNFKKGSSAVQQLELDSANRAGNSDRFWGDLLGGIGKTALTAGLSGQFMPNFGASGIVTTPGAPLNLLPSVAQPSVFASGTTPFLSYGRVA